MMLSGASSSSLSILLKIIFPTVVTTEQIYVLWLTKNLKVLYLMSSFWLCGGVGRAARISTLFTSSVTESAGKISYLESNYCTTAE